MTLHLTGFQPQAKVSRNTIPAARPVRHGVYANGGKRALDIALVLISLPAVLPLIALMALLVALDGSNPFYFQKRVGRDGRQFWMWKLRSMVPNAEAKLDAHLAACPAARAEWDRSQKLTDDPRITRVGNVLRKCSMDELPQLLNVLRGDMSLVGPRPMMPCQQALYPGQAYYRLRPGITGFWQISQRNLCSFANRAKFDSCYENKMSLTTDLRVLLGTVRVVLRCTGR